MYEELRKAAEARLALWEGTMKPLVMLDERDPEQQAEYEAAEAELDKLDARVAELTRNLEREASEDAAAEKRAEILSKFSGSPVSPNEVTDKDARYSEVFWKYARQGTKRMSADELDILEERAGEQRALGTTSGAVGGFTVPVDFLAQIVEGQLTFGGIRNAPITIINTSDGADVQVPTSNDTGNSGELIAENVAATELDVAFAQKTLKAWLWSSKIVRVPLTLMQDSAFDMQAFLARKFGERIGRAQAPYLITGTGSSQPEGIVTGTTVGHTTAATQTTTLIYDDFVMLEHSVDPAYRVNGHYILSDLALRQARLIKDDTGLPIWQAGMVGGFPNTINGYGYTVDVNMASVAATNKPVLFGDVSYYWLRDVIDFEFVRLDERYAEYRQAGFLAWARSDARKIDAADNPFKVLQMAAS